MTFRLQTFTEGERIKKNKPNSAARRINSNVECQQMQQAQLAAGFNCVCKCAQERATGSGEEIAAAAHFLSSCPAPGDCAGC